MNLESSCYFAGSRGILKLAHSRNREPNSSSNVIDNDILRSHTDMGAIYVCTDAIPNFLNNHLSLIQDRFVLVTGDSDLPITEEIFTMESMKRLLKSEKLACWYAQNLHFNHPKIKALPIGMDYHTAWERPGFLGMERQSAFTQEQSLIRALRDAPIFENRKLVCYSNFHFTLERGDRRECLEQIDKSVCFFERSRIPRRASWERSSQCMFVLSPAGAGADCHRTWESILLGCIPVVKRSDFTQIYQNLPVWVVDSWRDVNQTDLAPGKLIPYWVLIR